MNKNEDAPVLTIINGKYEIKCDDCKVTIGWTDSVGRSAQGGRCPAHKPSGR